MDEKILSVRDSKGRRKFIRQGAAVLLAGGGVIASGAAFGDDCDRGAASGEKKIAGNGSDSDAGDSADPTGCGKRDPQISRKNNSTPLPVTKISV